MAKTMAARRSLARARASRVWGLTESSAATTTRATSKARADDDRILAKAAWPGVSMKVEPPTRKAERRWVMPPASEAATLPPLSASRRVVFPWSTWPMTATTGGRSGRDDHSSVSGSGLKGLTKATASSTSLPSPFKYASDADLSSSASLSWYFLLNTTDRPISKNASSATWRSTGCFEISDLRMRPIFGTFFSSPMVTKAARTTSTDVRIAPAIFPIVTVVPLTTISSGRSCFRSRSIFRCVSCCA
mmetsp:Transcript_21004/g.67673  ORF Transcript_21004/g.67673 Transcript_21004/m.67673 type:complete len:247 (-) Transcript_21004:623-1363(-)